MLVICLYQCSRKLQDSIETPDNEYLTFKSLQGLKRHDLGKIFFFLVGCQEKKKQKHQHTCTYKHLRNMLMITAHALKKDLTCVTCYLVFSSQPSSRPWIISMLFLILSYTTEIKQFSAAWILKWK